MFCRASVHSELQYGTICSNSEMLQSINKYVFGLFLFSPSYRDKSSTSNMKIDTLAFLGCILAQHPPKVFHPHIHVLVPVSTCIKCFISCYEYPFGISCKPARLDTLSKFDDPMFKAMRFFWDFPRNPWL